MRLKHIKLAGFKSFVDPTKVAFPEQMTCIVGPNGCGKSNVIDAVRWVLGESSAKNLRGDAMTDVIFNGSQARKPVSQASVELVFDNTSGRVQGEFASFNEISVKRVVTRDAQSTYLLNGTKCRRRDITDLFLGTGLGPRSYAIIEQGMISRLIESRPQELRVFIEEAAGISKYKERRKETESRMNRTRDNLERLADVREELGQQLAKLQRQAAAARRYQTLKAEERELKAQLQALRWTQYQNQCDRLEHQVQKEEAELQKWVAEQRGSERGQTELREREADLKSQVDEIQQTFYLVNTEITKLEQQIQHTRQMNQQRERQGHEYRAQRQQLQEQAAQDEAMLLLLSEEMAEQAFQLQEVSEQLQIAQITREEAELAYEAWQETVQELREQHAERLRAISLLEAELQSAADLEARVRRRLAGIAEERAELPPADDLHRTELANQVTEQMQVLDDCVEMVHSKKAQIADVEAQLQVHQMEQQRVQNESTQMQGRIDSLNDLLASRVTSQERELDPWQGNKTALGRLREFLDVPERFRPAVEQLLDPWLTAPVYQETLPRDAINVNVLSVHPVTDRTDQTSTLAHFARADVKSLSLLTRFGYADTAEDALALLDTQTDILAVALPEGQIRGRDWVLIGGHEGSQLDWQAQRDALIDRQSELRVSLEQITAKVEQAQQALSEYRHALEHCQETQQAARTRLVQLQERLQTAEREHAQQELRVARLQQEQEELESQRDVLVEKQIQGSERLERHKEEQQNDNPALEQALREGETLQAARQQAAHTYQSIQQQQHERQMQRSQLQSKQEHTEQTLRRVQQQTRDLEQRLAELADIDEAVAEIALLEEDLAEQLVQRESVEGSLREIREQLAEVSGELGILNQGQSAVLEKIARQQERVQSGKMELAAARERGHALLDGLKDMNVSLKSVLETMPEEAEEKTWQARLEDTSRKIAQLGAINLAALEEVEVQAERKAYLDAQHEDLSASLQTLEDAIKKIDRETRQRFKVTFDQVNSDLQKLFPKVFGGGHAYLELTDDDLLETGVTIMARPPGKKNSTIHLLSGGEKALTALALVFAIFRLNPAPFCLLDEVDAPLDDVNVGRFCRLVSEMSESVQFIYISHNKIAMEMATHLSGVTMQEPGVSRLVAVDVEEALAMAEA
ncbi:chromosome segregation protein SMC [Aliidiomarina sanyensis]|uniref:Chromosome partition protein Smc n=1 Tax=Aliidiomarina sanyensis TaxID=1249555 RepID=A0A432WNB1_9GAMM|nr:chromosome segregation protein SMC [Aliidiomarina sanyensis]RUO35265.1 chromosome segregation protein SMC [Aliidiomarina sanyensis]